MTDNRLGELIKVLRAPASSIRTVERHLETMIGFLEDWRPTNLHWAGTSIEGTSVYYEEVTLYEVRICRYVDFPVALAKRLLAHVDGEVYDPMADWTAVELIQSQQMALRHRLEVEDHQELLEKLNSEELMEDRDTFELARELGRLDYLLGDAQ